MAVSSYQIVEFQRRARAAGYSDEEIEAAIRRKQMNTTEPVANPSLQPQIQLPQQTSQVAPNVPEAGLQMRTVGGQQTPQQGGGFVSRFIGALVEPAVNYGKMIAGAGYELGRAGIAKATRDQSIYLKQNPFLNEEELQTFSNARTAIPEGLKRTAGAMSYAIPAGRSVKTAAGLAGVAGGLDAVSREGATPEDIIKSTVTSGIFGGGLASGARAINAVKPNAVGDTLRKIGSNIKIQSYVKQMGVKPIKSEGGNSLLKSMKRIGIEPSDPENILTQATKVIQERSGNIFQATQQLDEKGVKIAVKDILSELQNRLKNAKSEVTRKPIQEVIDTIKTDLGKNKSIIPSDLYLLKAEYGPLGSWNSSSTTVEKTKAEIWREVYKKMNSIMDTTLKKNGFDEFRKINDEVHTAIKASQYAQRAGNIAPNRNTFGLLDLVFGGAGLSSGGVPMAIGTIAGKKVVESPRFQGALGSAVGKTGEILSNISQSNIPISGTPANTVIKTASSMMSGLPNEDGTINNNPENETSNQLQHENIITQAIPDLEEQPTPAKPFGSMTKQQLLGLAVNYGANLQDLKELSEIYDLLQPPEDETKLELSDGAIKSINDVQGALNDIQSLSQEISANDLVGPIKGLRVKNPYDEESRSLQAEIDRVRQVVGKALEGGVLRKEDEEKYKKILPTMTDTKEVALRKLTELEQKLNQDLNTYVKLQKNYGKGRGEENILNQNNIPLY